MSSVTIHLPTEVADALLRARGWTVESDRSFTRPGCMPYRDGGAFGADFLWQRDEALTEALTADLPAGA